MPYTSQSEVNFAQGLTRGVSGSASSTQGIEMPAPRLFGVQVQIIGNGFLLTTQWDRLGPQFDGFRPLFAKDHDECAEMIRKLLANAL